MMKKRDCIVLVFVMALVGCQKEVAYTPVQGGNSSGTAHQEEFTTFAATQGSTRTSMRADGQFSWTLGDNIFVETEPGTFAQATNTNITSTQTDAQFNFTGTFSKYSYPVRYTGTSNTNSSSVTIPSNQLQTAANNADHFGISGDCGVATATRNGDHYDFTLQHKASYLVFTPKTLVTPKVDYCYLLGIDVTDDSGGTLYGTYDFSDAGLDISSATSTGNTIELEVCNTRETPENLYAQRESRRDVTGRIDLTDDGNFHLSNNIENTAYIVIQPGTHRLKVTYHVAYFRLQTTIYRNDVTAGTEYYRNNWWYFDYDDNVQDITVTVDATARDYQPGYFYTIASTLTLEEPAFEYEFTGYYQWNASHSYWRFLGDGDLSGNPGIARNNNEVKNVSQATVNGSTSITSGDVNLAITNSNNAATSPKFDYIPNANAMTWYIHNGDIHRDMESKWWMKGFHDGYTLCVGGIWMKKWEYLPEKRTDISAPIPGLLPTIEQMDLRSNIPSDSYDNTLFRKSFTAATQQSKPEDSEISKYFYLPDRGFYNTTWKNNGTYDLELKLLGAEGYYWTSTALPDDSNDSNKRRRTAYCLWINTRDEFVQLKWRDDNNYFRRFGLIAGTRPDGQNWFQ